MAYWVVGEDGTKHSNEPLPLARAKKQLTALNIAHAQKMKLRGGRTITDAQVNRMYEIANWVMGERPFAGAVDAPTIHQTVEAAVYVFLHPGPEIIENLENIIEGRWANHSYDWVSHLRNDALYINHILDAEMELGHEVVPPDEDPGGGGGGGGGDAEPGAGGRVVAAGAGRRGGVGKHVGRQY